MNYYNEINQILHTTNDLLLLTQEIEKIQQTLYHTNESFHETLQSQIRASTSQFLQTILADIEPNKNNPQQNEISKTLQDILTFTQSLPIINITLAIEPSIQFITEISTFIRKEIVPNAILKITLDPEILSGLILDYNGHYWDYSLKKQLSTFNFQLST